MKVKVCLHNHTFNSKKSINTVDDYRHAFDSGLIDKVAITDHNYMQEAKNFQRIFGEDKIIIGEEISTKDGDVIGLFLKKFVTSGLTAERTIDLIKAQGAVVYIPHPFAKKGIGEELLEKFKKDIDVVEIYNGWTFRNIMKPLTSVGMNTKAEEWAKENRIPGFSSSDAHYRTDIGSCYTIMEDFSSQQEFLNSLEGDLEYMKRKNQINLLSVRTWVKGNLRRDFLSFIK